MTERPAWPTLDQALELPVDELAVRVLWRLVDSPQDNVHGRRDLVLREDPTQGQVAHVYAEAWDWLITHNLISPQPDNEALFFVTRRGQHIANADDSLRELHAETLELRLTELSAECDELKRRASAQAEVLMQARDRTAEVEQARDKAVAAMTELQTERDELTRHLADSIAELSNTTAARRDAEGAAQRLEAELAQTVRRGRFEMAARAAMREVEIRVRELAGASKSDLGVNLMKQSFEPDGGSLADANADRGEQEAIMALFWGAIGVFKNPSSHREVNLDDPTEAAEVVLLADLLMRILDGREPDNTSVTG